MKKMVNEDADEQETEMVIETPKGIWKQLTNLTKFAPAWLTLQK